MMATGDRGLGTAAEQGGLRNGRQEGRGLRRQWQAVRGLSTASDGSSSIILHSPILRPCMQHAWHARSESARERHAEAMVSSNRGRYCCTAPTVGAARSSRLPYVSHFMRFLVSSASLFEVEKRDPNRKLYTFSIDYETNQQSFNLYPKCKVLFDEFYEFLSTLNDLMSI